MVLKYINNTVLILIEFMSFYHTMAVYYYKRGSMKVLSAGSNDKIKMLSGGFSGLINMVKEHMCVFDKLLPDLGKY